MDLVNTTPLVARALLGPIGDPSSRVGMVLAKATWKLDSADRLVLDTEAPVELLLKDQETPLGIVPSDVAGRQDPLLEVVVLAAAYAPQAIPIETMRVGFSLGTEQRELLVFGDRAWERRGKEPSYSRPRPFVRMPLSPEKAFGGRCEVLLDREAAVEVLDPVNPLGKGFDPEPYALGLCKTLKAPDGYPKLPAVRLLPNLESASAPIRAWTDRPKPAYWSAVPWSSGMQGFRAVLSEGKEDFSLAETMYHRAHPDMVFAVPPARAEVLLQGVTPTGELRFRLPAMRVLLDYSVGGRVGTRELAPQVLVIEAEQRRFTVLYRHRFTTGYESGMERSMRLRTEPGWYVPTEE